MWGSSEEHREWVSELCPREEWDSVYQAAPASHHGKVISSSVRVSRGALLVTKEPWGRMVTGASTGAVRCHLGKAGCCSHGLRAREAKLPPGIVTVGTSLLVSLPAGPSLLQAEGWTLPGGLQPWLMSLYFLLDVQCADITIPPSTEHLLYSKAPGVVSLCALMPVILVRGPAVMLYAQEHGG